MSCNYINAEWVGDGGLKLMNDCILIFSYETCNNKELCTGNHRYRTSICCPHMERYGSYIMYREYCNRISLFPCTRKHLIVFI